MALSGKCGVRREHRDFDGAANLQHRRQLEFHFEWASHNHGAEQRRRQ
jgi:type III secretory pathway component EscU